MIVARCDGCSSLIRWRTIRKFLVNLTLTRLVLLIVLLVRQGCLGRNCRRLIVVILRLCLHISSPFLVWFVDWSFLMACCWRNNENTFYVLLGLFFPLFYFVLLFLFVLIYVKPLMNILRLHKSSSRRLRRIFMSVSSEKPRWL